MNFPFCRFGAVTIVLLGSAVPTFAVTEVDAILTTSQGAYNGIISASDLINASQASVSSYIFSNGTGTADAGTGYGGIYNGSAVDDQLTNPGSLTYFGASQFGTSLTGTPTLTVKFNLNDGTGGSSTGYTLSSIQSINGWRDFASMSDQKYTISISTDPAQVAFSSFYSVDYHPFNPANDLNAMNQPSSSLVTLTDLNLSGVTAIRFTFSTYNSGTQDQAGQLIREIDVNGTATAVPEPSVYALVLLGGGAFLFGRRNLRPNFSPHQSLEK